MRAAVHGLEIMPVWCSPLRHSWTVQCWTRTERREWICTLTGRVEMVTSSGQPVWQLPAVLHLTPGSVQSSLFWLWMVFLSRLHAKSLWKQPSKVVFVVVFVEKTPEPPFTALILRPGGNIRVFAGWNPLNANRNCSVSNSWSQLSW